MSENVIFGDTTSASGGTNKTPTQNSKHTRKPKKKRGPMARLFRLMLWILLLIFILFLLALGLVWFLAGTDKGFDYAVYQAAQRVDGLNISEPDGNLNRGVAAKDLSFNNDTINIQVNGINTAWQTPCLLDGKFCFNSMVIDQLRVESLVEPQPATGEKRTDAIVLPTIDIPIDVDIEDIHVKEFIFQPPGDVEPHVVNDIRLKAQTEGNTLTIENLSAAYANYTAVINGEITLEDDYPLSMSIAATATDVIEEHDFSFELDASNSVADLTIDGILSGAANAEISGQLQPLEPSLPLTINVSAETLGWPLDTLALAKATGLSLDVEGDMNDFNVALVSSVSGEQIPQTNISVDAVANPARVLVPNITVQTLDGFATGSAAASLGEQISWVSDLIIKDINPSQFLPDIEGTLNGLVRANGGVHEGRWMLNLTEGKLSGELRGIPFDLDAVVSKDYQERWSVSKVILNNGENRVNATGNAGDALDFNADINLVQLQNFLPGLAGGFTGNVKVSGAPTSPNISLTANSSVLKYQDTLIRNLSLSANVEEGASGPSSLKLNVDKVQQGTQVVRNTRLALDGTRDQHTIKFFADGPEATAIDLTANGALSESFDWLGELNSVLLELPAHKVALAKPFNLGWDNEIKKASIDAHCWTTEETQLCLKNEVLAEPTGTATISLTRYPLARLNPFLPAGSELQGLLQADATVLWGEKQPGGYNATLVGKIDQGGIKVVDDAFDELSFSYDTFTLDGRATGEQLDANVSLRSTGLGNANVELTMDPTQDSKPIDGNLVLKGFDISFLKAFLPQFDEIGGVINSNGTISGSLSDPRFNGQVVLNKPIVQAESLPLNIDGGRVTVRVDGKRARIRGGLNSGSGKLNVSGTANWSVLDAWKANVSIEGNDLNVQADPLVESLVKTDVQIALIPGDVRIRGNVAVPMAKIEVAEVAPGATALSDDVIIIEDEAAEAAANNAESVEPGETDIDIKLNVSLGDDVRLEAFGLKAQLAGDMTVALSPPRPVELGGEVRIVEGIFKQYGQDLLVEDGQVLFVGPVDNTRLSMDAVRVIEGEDRVAGLRVGGPLAAPEVSLFTEPSNKSQDSILSYILLGRDINEASDQEQNLLASAALALTLRGGRGKATEFAEAFGVEEFSLDARGRGDDTEVVVSGRLNDKLLVRYGRNVFSNGQTLYLRYDITRQLYLEAAEGLESAVDLFYSFSF